MCHLELLPRQNHSEANWPELGDILIGEPPWASTTRASETNCLRRSRGSRSLNTIHGPRSGPESRAARSALLCARRHLANPPYNLTVGSLVHGFNRTIDWQVVRRLATGNIPTSATGLQTRLVSQRECSPCVRAVRSKIRIASVGPTMARTQGLHLIWISMYVCIIGSHPCASCWSC